MQRKNEANLHKISVCLNRGQKIQYKGAKNSNINISDRTYTFFAIIPQMWLTNSFGKDMSWRKGILKFK